MLKYLTGFICLLVFYTNCSAQILSPLDSYPIQQSGLKASKRNAKASAEGDTLQLPFFEDFAAYTGEPNADKWERRGGVYVNNQFGVNPPSINVATFEGVDAAGMPYSSFTSYGYTDSLTSKPINLEGLNPATAALYLSFYWQAGGLGGAPDNNTDDNPVFLALEFKDRNENWVSVWQQFGENEATAFTREIIALSNPDFFHAGFQFRFRSSGIRKGTDDTWNLDYIFLDKNRDPAKADLPDVALSQRLNSFLERYTAMPVNQFLANPEAEVNDSAYTWLNNFNNQFTPITWRGYIKPINPAVPADTFLRGNAAIRPLENQFLINGTLTANNIPNNSNQILIKHSVFLNTLENNALTRYNDTVARTTELFDYFAYDDGTAETNFSLNPFGNRQLAYRFDLNTPGYVRGIRVYLSKTNRENSIINFRIWDDENGNPSGTVRSQKAFTIPGVDTLNRFYDIEFSAPVEVNDKFYIGFSLTSSVNDFVNIGYDLNEAAPGRVLYNNGAGWLSFDDVKGALLMRPLMGMVTSTDEEKELANAITISPNPGNGLFKINGQYQELCLTDLTGKIILCKPAKAITNDILDLRSLANGIYLVRFTQKNIIVTKKIVLTR